jgi:hypothetical protein
MKIVAVLFALLPLAACGLGITIPAPSTPALDDNAADGEVTSVCHVVCENGGALRVPRCALACPDDIADPNNSPVDLNGQPPPTPPSGGSVPPNPGAGGGVPCGNPH